MPQNIQADPAELEARLEVVRGLFAQGLNQAKVVQYIREKCADWGINDRQARNYCYAVWKQYGDEATGVDRAAYFVRTLERLDHIYGAAMKVSDFKTALSATAELIKLLRLDIPSADFDWKAVAKQAGLSPSDVLAKVAEFFAATEGLENVEIAAESSD